MGGEVDEEDAWLMGLGQFCAYLRFLMGEDGGVGGWSSGGTRPSWKGWFISKGTTTYDTFMISIPCILI